LVSRGETDATGARSWLPNAVATAIGGEHWHWEYHPDQAAGMAAAKKFRRPGVNPQ
jgi:hypothetical protein